MSNETIFVFILLGAAAVLFASNRVRLDIVALLIVLALMLGGVLSPKEALAGFGEPVVMIIGGLLVIGEMLSRTGIAYAISAWILRTGGRSEPRLLLLIMLAAAMLSAVMSSTAVVAIFIPIVMSVAGKTNTNPGRLLMPLAFAALIGGMLTLIATAPNLVVSAAVSDAGLESFHFFSFAPVGLAVLGVGIGYILLTGRHLLGKAALAVRRRKRATIVELARDFGFHQRIRSLRMAPDSSLAGQTVAGAQLESRYKLRLLAVQRSNRGRKRELVLASPSLELRAGDELVMVGTRNDTKRLAAAEGLAPRRLLAREAEQLIQELGMAVVLVHPESRLIGKTLRQFEFRSEHGVHVLGLRRGRRLVGDFAETPLRAADSLLIAGPWDRIVQLQGNTRDFVMLAVPLEIDEVAPARRRAPIALAILLGMVLLSMLQIVSVLVAVMIAALAAVFTRCLTMEDAYRAIHWGSLVLIAGMLALASALDKTGGVRLVVEFLVSNLGGGGPYLILSVFFWLTALLGLLLSNTATSVIMAPIAIQAAQALELSPYPLAMAIAIAASAGFATPVSSPVLTLVLEPGRYRFFDYMRVGTPLMLLSYLVALFAIPFFFPFV